jgi:protein ImuA
LASFFPIPSRAIGSAQGLAIMTASGETVRHLSDRIRTLETSFRLVEPATIPLGGGGLGDLFPGGRLATGSLVELLPSAPGAGALTLALLLARHACGERKALLIADTERCFYPPAARKYGIDLDRTIIVRARTSADALLALAQSLRCTAVGAALGALDRLTDRDGRRLQLAAESGGAVGVLLRPMTALGSPSFASVRLRLDPLPALRNSSFAIQSPRRMRLEVLRCRGGCEGKTIGVEVDDATGHVRTFSLLELAADLASSARSTG